MPTSFITRFLEGVERVMVPLHGILNIPSEPRYPIQLYVSQRLSSHRQREKARLRRRIIERATGGLNPTDPNRKGETLPIPLPRNLYSICILLYSFPCKRPNNLQLPFQMPSPPPYRDLFFSGSFVLNLGTTRTSLPRLFTFESIPLRVLIATENVKGGLNSHFDLFFRTRFL